MAEYNFQDIEKKWQRVWDEKQPFKVASHSEKPKFYALDMFPYPSGAGLHVGHPLGYIASDIVCRYKRTKGYNVLHPMGFDAFGLPAEQYAIDTGQHPEVTTQINIKRYISQLKSIGLSYDWSKTLQTCNPDYYKWTQWIFIQLFESWYDLNANKAQDIAELVAFFNNHGNANINAVSDEETPLFTDTDWKNFSERQQQHILLKYRLAYLAETTVNWCPNLGTVLSHDEIKDGLSERGGHAVVKKKMKQWSMRVSAYADRLLQGLDGVAWSEALKTMQKNWIGKSIGAEMTMQIDGHEDKITVFTTRIDTVFGMTFIVLAPELEITKKITTLEQSDEIDHYIKKAKNKSDRNRMTHVKKVSGAFTGAYAIHPFTGEQIPIWVADYVLAGYGTGAVMAVPGGDQRDYDFAKHFDLPILPIYEHTDIAKKANATKEGKIITKGLLQGLTFHEATTTAIGFLEKNNVGKGKVNFKIRDAIFARQRYWGEPVPIYFKAGVPYAVAIDDLPLRLPKIDKYRATEDGKPPLGRAKNYNYTPKGSDQAYPLELSTMPGWAGSSWYWLRYMDVQNSENFVDKSIQNYWKEVDLYIGGTEHAVGHLLYARFWNKFLFDKGWVSAEEPFKKLVNQGMIQGRSNKVYRVKNTNKFVSWHQKDHYDHVSMYVDINMVANDELDIEAFKKWRPDLADAQFILDDGKYICGYEVEKMSKSKFNVVNPDFIIKKYGADTLRMYEMFLGPLEQFKPWNTNGIDGVFKFLKKTWKLYHNNKNTFSVSNENPTKKEQKIINKTIKKVEEDINNLSLNTSISTLMIAVNELKNLKCDKREVLEKLAIILSPFAPHITEELWSKLGYDNGISQAKYPQVDESTLVEHHHEYPISINGKVRTKVSFAIDLPKEQIEKEILTHEIVVKWTESKAPKKVIIVPKKIINIVV